MTASRRGGWVKVMDKKWNVGRGEGLSGGAVRVVEACNEKGNKVACWSKGVNESRVEGLNKNEW